MKKIFYAVIVFSYILTILPGCNQSNNVNEPDQTIHGSGRLVMQERNITECTAINLRNSGNIYLNQDSVQTIKIEADDNIIDKVVTQYQDGTLITGLQKGSYSDVTVKIYISLNTIENLSIDGAGNIVVQNPINCSQLGCIINGAGDIVLLGDCNSFNCSINGAGNINAFAFEAKNCKAIIKGTGNCSIYVTESLEAVISGAGNIIYEGNPGIVNSSVTGIGNISRR